jgi:hypothetical protein
MSKKIISENNTLSYGLDYVGNSKQKEISKR